MEIWICKNCGRKFEKSVHNKKYCTDKCRWEDYKNKRNKCEYCSNIFSQEWKYCSKSCKINTRKVSKWKEMMKWYKDIEKLKKHPFVKQEWLNIIIDMKKYEEEINKYMNVVDVSVKRKLMYFLET